MPPTTDDRDDESPAYPDPRAAATAVADRASDGGPGVARDELMDAKLDAANAAQQVAEMYVRLDAICDDRGLLPADVARDLRTCQRQLQALATWLERYRDSLTAEYDAAIAAARDAATNTGDATDA